MSAISISNRVCHICFKSSLLFLFQIESAISVSNRVCYFCFKSRLLFLFQTESSISVSKVSCGIFCDCSNFHQVLVWRPKKVAPYFNIALMVLNILVVCDYWTHTLYEVRVKAAKDVRDEQTQ